MKLQASFSFPGTSTHLCLEKVLVNTLSFTLLCFCPIQIAWALNKGVKQEYKQFWDVDLGVTYIPWEKVKLDDLDDFAEGGIIDQETVNDGENLSLAQALGLLTQ